MGYGATPESVARDRPSVPKIAFLGEPREYRASDGKQVSKEEIALCGRIISMGRLHHTFTATGLMALSACSLVPGSIANSLARPHSQHAG